MPYILSRTALSWTPRCLPPSLRRRQSKRALGRASAGPHGSGGPPAEYGSFIAFDSSINATRPLQCVALSLFLPFPPYSLIPFALSALFPLSCSWKTSHTSSHGGCLLQSFLCIFYHSFTYADPVFFHTFPCVQCKVSRSLTLSLQLP